MLNIVLFGAPGAGKGTQSEKLISHYNLAHISTGDLLRAELKAQTPLGIEAKKYMDRGDLVPDQVVIGMIENKLPQITKAGGCIFDGFPRTQAQAKALDTLLNASGLQINGVVAINVPETELVNRLLNRGKTSGRTDDQDAETIKNRVANYNRDTKPVADYYNQQGKLVTVEGVGEIDSIFDRIRLQIDKLISK